LAKNSSFQNIGTLLALAISSIALMVSMYQTNLLRAKQKAMVWPYVTVAPSFSGRGFSYVATNNGVGPALIKSVSSVYQGQSFTRYEALLDSIKADHHIGYDYMKMSRFNETVMKAGEERVLFNIPWDEESRAMAPELRKATFTIQYCSVLDDCWVFKSNVNTREEGRFKAEVEFEN